MTNMTDVNAIRFVTITGPEADELALLRPVGLLFDALATDGSVVQLYALSEKEYPQNWLDVDDPGSVGVAEGATDVAGSLAFGTTGLSADTVTALKNAYGLEAYPLSYTRRGGEAELVYPSTAANEASITILQNINICATHPGNPSYKCNRNDLCWYKKLGPQQFIKLQPPQGCTCTS